MQSHHFRDILAEDQQACQLHCYLRLPQSYFADEKSYEEPEDLYPWPEALDETGYAFVRSGFVVCALAQAVDQVTHCGLCF